MYDVCCIRGHGLIFDSQFKARPGPDPLRPEETEWMTKAEVENEVMKPSRSWTDAGNGKVRTEGSLDSV